MAARCRPTIQRSMNVWSAPAATHSSAICRYRAASSPPSPNPSAVPAHSASRSVRPAAACFSSVTAASATVPRFYHSVALLLPDGRVATAGSNPNRGDDELRIEIFHPPYLFQGQRPFIEDAPTEISYGGHYELRTPNAGSLQWVQLIRPMATTHSCDTEQRIVDLAFTVHGPCAARITIPSEPNLAPPGWWMLNVVDTKRRP
jgi:hypothetical protein